MAWLISCRSLAIRALDGSAACVGVPLKKSAAQPLISPDQVVITLSIAAGARQDGAPDLLLNDFFYPATYSTTLGGPAPPSMGGSAGAGWVAALIAWSDSTPFPVLAEW